MNKRPRPPRRGAIKPEAAAKQAKKRKKTFDISRCLCYSVQAALKGSKHSYALSPPERDYRKVENSMQAIIVTGGKQYNVSEGDELFIEKLNVNADDTVTFDQVLAIVDGENSKFGTPVVDGASVEAKVLKNGKAKKVTVFKYRPKKDSKSIRGHRQPYTKVKIEKIHA